MGISGTTQMTTFRITARTNPDGGLYVWQMLPEYFYAEEDALARYVELKYGEHAVKVDALPNGYAPNKLPEQKWVVRHTVQLARMSGWDLVLPQ